MRGGPVSMISKDIAGDRVDQLLTATLFRCRDVWRAGRAVAEFLASAAFSGPSGAHSVFGPEALTFVDVVHLYERILGAGLRVQRTPAAVFRIAAPLIRPFSSAGANLMALNYIGATEETPADDGAAAAFGVRLTTAEAFLRAKAAMAANI